MASRYFGAVFDAYWTTENSSKPGEEREVRLAEPRDIKLPQGVSFEGSRSLKTATGQAKALGCFEYLQLLEQYFREQNIAPHKFARRTVCLLQGITSVQVRSVVHTFVQSTSCYSEDENKKWGTLRQTLLEEYAPLHWCHALISEWLNSLSQGNKPMSLFLANARHWSTIIAMMLPEGQRLPEPLLGMILSAQSKP